MVHSAQLTWTLKRFLLRPLATLQFVPRLLATELVPRKNSKFFVINHVLRWNIPTSVSVN